jgi:hypothetical protein
VTGGCSAAAAVQRKATGIVKVAPIIATPHIILSLRRGGQKRQNASRVKPYWEIIADNLSKAGWSLGWVSAIDSNGRTIWIADMHREGRRFVVHADDKLTVFIELQSAIRACGQLSRQAGKMVAK